jgi:hypothetical protein
MLYPRRKHSEGVAHRAHRCFSVPNLPPRHNHEREESQGGGDGRTCWPLGLSLLRAKVLQHNTLHPERKYGEGVTQRAHRCFSAPHLPPCHQARTYGEPWGVGGHVDRWNCRFCARKCSGVRAPFTTHRGWSLALCPGYQHSGSAAYV